MGYTHYWTKRANVTPQPSRWRAFTEAAEKVLSNCADCVEVDECSLDGIFFNGIGEAAHETFDLPHSSTLTEDFSFCKTAEKPYDTPVVAILLLLQHYCGDTYNISSDGNLADWQAGADLCKVLNLPYEFPAGLQV